jgi:hypothetical protein
MAFPIIGLVSDEFDLEYSSILLTSSNVYSCVITFYFEI